MLSFAFIALFLREKGGGRWKEFSAWGIKSVDEHSLQVAGLIASNKESG